VNRFFILIVTVFTVLSLTSFLGLFQTVVTVTANIPEVIEAGTEITVNVTINKGKQSGSARFQQELPVGFTAKPLNSANADFSFQDQKVRLMWFQVSADNIIKFSYKIVANERLKGEVELQGSYGYSDNNERKTVAMTPVSLTIKPSARIAAENQIDIKDYAKHASIEEAAAGTGHTVALRQQPAWMEEDKIYIVTLLINRDAASKYAKIEEKTPAGFTAAGLDCKGGIFSFSGQTAKIMWSEMPLEPYFTVTYKLIPNEAAGAGASVSISGAFTFMISDRTFTSPVVERKESLAGIGREQLNGILSDVRSSSGQPTQIVDNRGSNGQTQQQQKQPPQQPQQPQQQQPRQQQSQNAQNNQNRQQTTPGQRVTVPSNAILQPEPGIRYRVQIAAGHRQISIPRTFKQYRLVESQIKREEHEGWYKYTSDPSFDKYRDARDYRVQLSNTNDLKDAFVVAYNNGKRITVQEALMALNQKWIP